MENINKFNPGDPVNYIDGMDFQDFTGMVESIENKKGLWEYMVKDFKHNSIKRVAERFLAFSVPPLKIGGTKSQFNPGDNVHYRNEIEMKNFTGIVQRSINNYKGQWEYFVKDSINDVIERVAEKYMVLIKE